MINKKMPGMLWTTLATIAGIYIVICILLFIFQRFLIYFPDKQIILTPDQYGLAYEDVFLESDDGIKIHGWLIKAEAARGVLLFCHGNAGNISHRFESIRFFNRLSLDVLIFDYRGFGKSEGSPDEKGTYLDAAAAWKYLIETKGYHPDQIIIFGRSLGSGIAAWLASEKHSKTVILESSFTSLPDLGAKVYPFFPVRLLSRYKYDTLKNLQQITCPILFIHSKNDEIIPYSLGYKNFHLAPEPKTFLEISGSHNDGFLTSGKIYENGIRGFLQKYFWEEHF
jgi:pimeloyl-ACP methyl ester carboxylesterase